MSNNLLFKIVVYINNSKVLVNALKKKEYQVLECKSSKQIQELYKVINMDLIILSNSIEHNRSMKLLQRIKNTPNTCDVPVVIYEELVNSNFTPKGFLDNGADEYVHLNTEIEEILSIINSVLRRIYGKDMLNGYFATKNLKVDFCRYKVEINKKEISLTITEFNILKLLIMKKGKVIPKWTIIEELWGNGKNYIKEKTLDMHISRLRMKLQNYKYLIKTIRGIGYCFSDK